MASNAWAYTHISTAESCLRLFGERYVKKTLPYVESPEMKKGKWYHQQMQLRLIANPIPLPAELAALEPVCQSLLARGIAHVELPVAITKDFKACDYWSDEAWQRGNIDLAVLGDTTGIAVDWKTGDPQYEQPFQLEIYAVNLMARFPHLEKVTVFNFYFRTNKPGTPRTYTRATDFPKIAADMMRRWDTVERARAAGSFPAMPNPFCSGCDVKSCEFRREKRLK